MKEMKISGNLKKPTPARLQNIVRVDVFLGVNLLSREGNCQTGDRMSIWMWVCVMVWFVQITSEWRITGSWILRAPMKRFLRHLHVGLFFFWTSFCWNVNQSPTKEWESVYCCLINLWDAYVLVGCKPFISHTFGLTARLFLGLQVDSKTNGR